jgi:DNA-binding winged helix-turn-helix (wHTH) protein
MLINNRFEVNPSRSEVLDRDSKKLIRLEPRLMKLLCMLIESKGQIVTREVIIKEIWDDYPGGGEGLNQSISGLRKILHDEGKQLIETLPKMGYCFHGYVRQSSPVPQEKSFTPVYLLAGLIIFIIAVFSFRQSYHSNSSPDNLSQEESRHISKIDSAHQAEIWKKSQN